MLEVQSVVCLRCNLSLVSSAGAESLTTVVRLPLRSRFFPFLNWPAPSLEFLRGEALVGITVGLMVIPQGVAYAALAGMPLVTGIYASLFPALIAVLFSASTRLSVGPTALTCLLVGTSLTGLAERSSPKWVGLAIWLALFLGGLQVLLGLGRFGGLLNLVSSPVLMAFKQAAAVLIIGSQVPHLLGMPGWSEIQGMLGSGIEVEAIPAPHPMSAAFGLGHGLFSGRGVGGALRNRLTGLTPQARRSLDGCAASWPARA